MKNFTIIIFSTISLLLSSCEEDVVGVSLPYKEQLVIRAVLESGSPIGNIRVEKTLPPLENYSPDKAIIQNATLIIEDGSSIDTLTYANGYYHSKLIARPGVKYRLKAIWKNHKAYAETVVPEPVDFDFVSVEFKRNDYVYGEYNAIAYTLIDPRPEYVYQGAISMEGIIYSPDEIFTYSNVDRNGKLRVNLYYTGGNDTNDIKKTLKFFVFVIAAYDKQFYDYFITKYNGNSSGDIFGNLGTNVRWNVTGDGIGMFIGRSIRIKKVNVK